MRRVRPDAWEVLEARIALSHAPRLGAIGDSLSDEYRFYPPNRSEARNWVETLAASGRADFGAYTTGSRGLPRNQGYANDWAQSGATTEDVVRNQLPGFVRQVQSGAVQYAAVEMSTDDFLEFFETAFTTTQDATSTTFTANLASVTATAIANLDLTVNTLLAASPTAKVILATDPDVRTIPLVVQLSANPAIAAAAGAISTAEATVNNQIRAVALANPGRVAVADIAAQEAAFIAGSTTTRPYGGTTLQLTTTGQNPRDLILGDAIHPGTIAQGLIANAEVSAADSLGATIRPLKPAAIVQHARYVATHFRTAR